MCPRENTEKKKVNALPDFSLLKEIRTFEIQLGESGFSELYFQALKYIYTKCENIDELFLNFRNHKFASEGLMDFIIDSFWVTKKVKKLSLDISGSKVSDAIMTGFITNYLGKTTHIRGLRLCLDASEITDRTILALASKFMSKATNLSRFSLDLGNLKITDKSIKYLLKRTSLE